MDDQNRDHYNSDENPALEATSSEGSTSEENHSPDEHSEPSDSGRTARDRGLADEAPGASEGAPTTETRRESTSLPNYHSFDLEEWCEENFEEIQPQPDGSFNVTCPAHDDSTPSLHVSIGEKEGQILMYCFAGCPIEDVLKAALLEWNDLYPDNVPTRATTPRLRRQSLDVEFVHEVYQELINNLQLSDEDSLHLRERGLSDERIAKNHYRSLTFTALQKPFADLHQKYGNRLFRVPGFFREKRQDKNLRDFELLRLTQEEGILIPVRDAAGQIVACQVRAGMEGRKYVWLSSREAPVITTPHVPLGVAAPCPVVRLTEGPLKADVVMALDSSVPCIGVGGVAAWEKALPVLKELQVSTVRLAFDADQETKPNVAQAVHLCGESLVREGYEVLLEKWGPEQGKGLDDLLNAGHSPQAEPFLPERIDTEPSTILKTSSDPASVENGRATINKSGFPAPVPISHVATTAHNRVEWIVDGLIPRGGMTQFVGLWKAGKTTFLLHLLKALSNNESTFCGCNITPSKVLLITQENDAIWNQRREQCELSDKVVFLQRGPDDYPQPFSRRPSESQWERFVEHLLETTRGHQFDLVVVDPIADFWPLEEENSASQVTRALLPLRRISQSGAGLLLLHHPGKRGGRNGTASRGSGALPSFVEVILELRRAGGKKRCIRAYSRYQETPEKLTVELTTQGYVRVEDTGSGSESRPEDLRERILAVLPKQPPGITSMDILEALQQKGDSYVSAGIDESVKRRFREVLEIGRKQGWFEFTGNSPYRYYSKEVANDSVPPSHE